MKMYRNVNLDYGENQAYIDEYMRELEEQRAAEAAAIKAAKEAERERQQAESGEKDDLDSDELDMTSIVNEAFAAEINGTGDGEE